MRCAYRQAKYAVCGQDVPDEDGPGGVGVLYWHTDEEGAAWEMDRINRLGGYAYYVYAPGGDLPVHTVGCLISLAKRRACHCSFQTI